jgi:cysteine synthase
MARRLAREEGILVGASGGTAVPAALRVAGEWGAGRSRGRPRTLAVGRFPALTAGGALVVVAAVTAATGEIS